MKTLQPIWWLEPLILFLYENRSNERFDFEYPDYGGLSKKYLKSLLVRWLMKFNVIGVIGAKLKDTIYFDKL